MERYREVVFPPKFDFGVNLGSPFQVEGSPPITDYTSPLQKGWWNEPSLFKSDLDLAQELGVKTARIGVEWARVEPELGRFDTDAIRKYQLMVSEIRERGIEPMLTLYHFTLPRHVVERGGWTHPAAASKFRDYARVVAQDIASDVPYILTMNEPSVFLTNGYLKGEWPPNFRLSPKLVLAFMNVVKAHNAAFRVVKESNPNANVGACESVRGFRPKGPLEEAEAKIRELFFNTFFFRFTNNDFHGVNYFTTYALKFAKMRIPERDETTVFRGDNGTLISPHNFLRTLERFYRTFKKPIVVTENGLADARDRFRGFFILSHLIAVHQAIERGIPVEGYLYWSLTDNYEWGDKSLGESRFGLASVDFGDLRRSPRRSYSLYKEICTSKVVDISSLSDRYLSDEERDKLDKILS